MFYYNGCIWQSDILNAPRVRHGFSTREGGISTKTHLASMNTGFFRGDDDETVIENIRLLCRLAGTPENVVCAPQVHSTEVRIVTPENGGEGTVRETSPCDGFACECAGISLLVRVADCAPVLMCGTREDNSPVVGAVHAGWRGAAGGIAAVCVEKMKKLGAVCISAAVGACIHSCCYEVGEDMMDEVRRLRGFDFASRHIKYREGRLYADIVGMNVEILHEAGVVKTDVCPDCTACRPGLYHSHRVTGGVRGTMGAVIGIADE